MKRIVIFGNSASGKTSLARSLSRGGEIAHLDLDSVAWKPVTPPERLPIAQSKRLIQAFTSTHERWVIEGCYSDLLTLALPHANEIIFLNLPIETCLYNARQRPWEPHKYESPEAQDANLDMLLDWIAQYDQRSDSFSRQAHQRLFDGFKGRKTMHEHNR